MAAYITYQDLETYTGNTYSAEQRTFITDVLIPAIQNEIEAYTGRKFGVGSDSDTTKTYYGIRSERFDYDPLGGELQAIHRQSEIDIDEFISITSLKEVTSDGVETTLDLNDFDLLPANTEYKNRIYSRNGAYFNGYKYKVTGKLGSTAVVPPEVKLACLQIATDALDSAQNIDSESIEGYSYTKGSSVFGANALQITMLGNPVVQQALGKWRKILI